MPLDGRNYSGRLPLLAPIYGHPSADAVGHALSGTVAACFQAMRHSCQLIGHTTYPWLASIEGFTQLAPASPAASYFTVAEHQDVLLPAVMTHIYAEVAFRLLAPAPSGIQGRIILTDGVNTDTLAPAAVEAFEEAGNAGAPPSSFTLADPNDPAFKIMGFRLTVANARVTSLTPAARTVRVQLNGAGAPIQPLLVSTFWEADG